MNTQNIQAQQLKLISWISQVQDVSLLKKLEKIQSKAENVSEEKALLISEIQEAVEEMKLIRAGKKEARPARELINEL